MATVFQACEDAGITAFAPSNRAVNNQDDGTELFDRMDFKYEDQRDAYQCPSGKLVHPEMMVSRRSIVEHPFYNLKQWIFGNGRFLLRQLKGA